MHSLQMFHVMSTNKGCGHYSEDIYLLTCHPNLLLILQIFSITSISKMLLTSFLSSTTQPPPSPSTSYVLHHGIVIITPDFNLILESTIKSLIISLVALDKLNIFRSIWNGLCTTKYSMNIYFFSIVIYSSIL